jgi:hypothetical protein
MDRDTQDVPGSPDIAKTILEKIERAQIFVGDVSIVNQGAKPTPPQGPCPQRGNHLRAFKCEMIDVVLGKLSGCLTPNTRMISFRVVISNRPAY